MKWMRQKAAVTNEFQPIFVAFFFPGPIRVRERIMKREQEE